MQSHSLVNLTPTALCQLLSLYLCFCAFQLPPMIVTVGARQRQEGAARAEEAAQADGCAAFALSSPAFWRQCCTVERKARYLENRYDCNEIDFVAIST